jgi:hypothetical protein
MTNPALLCRLSQRLSICGLLLAASVAGAAEPPTPTTIHGLIDLAAVWNSNRPGSHENFESGTGTSGKRGNEFSLNLVAVDVVRDAKPLGFHLSVVAGSGADIVHAGEPAGSAIGRDVYRHIYQASVLYKVSDRLLLEAGVFPSHIGFESFYSKDNWNYTRSWLGEFSPYYQAGIHVTYRLNDRWTGEVHVLNGWQIIGDNNDAKAIGLKIAYSDDRLSTSFNTFDGPELADDNSHWRHFGDLIATYKVTAAMSIGASVDRGHQSLPDEATANWLGAAGYGRYTLSPKSAIALRAEIFRDSDRGITGARQKLREATVTWEHRPVENLILKIEARHDRSSVPSFARGKNEQSRSETLIVLGAVATF